MTFEESLPTTSDRAPTPGPRRQAGILTHIFFILFCLEIGLVLVLLPWTFFWDNNYFFSLTPRLGELWLSTYLRGGVSGIGMINLWIGLSEAWRMWR
jgi:hypothetical protein